MKEKHICPPDPSSESEARFRKPGAAADITADDFQSQLLSDEQKREKMVEDMITMAREWKEQSKIANKIIRKDIDVSLVLSCLCVKCISSAPFLNGSSDIQFAKGTKFYVKEKLFSEG